MKLYIVKKGKNPASKHLSWRQKSVLFPIYEEYKIQEKIKNKGTTITTITATKIKAVVYWSNLLSFSSLSSKKFRYVPRYIFC